jgi:hypothetical protein
MQSSIKLSYPYPFQLSDHLEGVKAQKHYKKFCFYINRFYYDSKSKKKISQKCLNLACIVASYCDLKKIVFPP